MSPTVITPNAARNLRRNIALDWRDARAFLRTARELRAKGRSVDLEDAISYIGLALDQRLRAQTGQRLLREATVVKYNNLSPNAAKREATRRGSL